MAVRDVPPPANLNAAGASPRRPERSFAALYEQARRASINDNTSDERAGSGEEQRARAEQAEQNRKYIDGLHEKVDTLRGELLVRVIQSGRAPREEATRVTGDISRLSARLDTLRRKLDQEETRLSGKLVDVEA